MFNFLLLLISLNQHEMPYSQCNLLHCTLVLQTCPPSIFKLAQQVSLLLTETHLAPHKVLNDNHLPAQVARQGERLAPGKPCLQAAARHCACLTDISPEGRQRYKHVLHLPSNTWDRWCQLCKLNIYHRVDIFMCIVCRGKVRF